LSLFIIRLIFIDLWNPCRLDASKMQIKVLTASNNDNFYWYFPALRISRNKKIGLLGGVFLKICGLNADLNIMETGFPKVFFLVLIAPIIYESAYNTNKKVFYQNFGSVLMYAFLGTFLAAVVTTALIFALGYYGFCPVYFLVRNLKRNLRFMRLQPMAL